MLNYKFAKNMFRKIPRKLKLEIVLTQRQVHPSHNFKVTDSKLMNQISPCNKKVKYSTWTDRYLVKATLQIRRQWTCRFKVDLFGLVSHIPLKSQKHLAREDYPCLSSPPFLSSWSLTRVFFSLPFFFLKKSKSKN